MKNLFSSIGVWCVVAAFAASGAGCGGGDDTTDQPSATGVDGTITLGSAIRPLADGAGTMCIGLYDPAKACPVGGDTNFVRIMGQSFKGVDLNATPEYHFSLTGVSPGTYLFSARLDADESGCDSAPNSGDAYPKGCASITVLDGKVVQVAQELTGVIP